MTLRAPLQADARVALVVSLHLSLELPPSLIARLEALADSNASSLDEVATLLLTTALDDRSAWVTGEGGLALHRGPTGVEPEPHATGSEPSDPPGRATGPTG